MYDVGYYRKQKASEVTPPRTEQTVAFFIDQDSGAPTILDYHGRKMAIMTLATQFCRYTPTISTQGTTATPSVIKITAKDLLGNEWGLANDSGYNQSNSSDLLRVGIYDDGTFTPAGAATIAASNGSALQEALDWNHEVFRIDENEVSAPATSWIRTFSRPATIRRSALIVKSWDGSGETTVTATLNKNGTATTHSYSVASGSSYDEEVETVSIAAGDKIELAVSAGAGYAGIELQLWWTDDKEIVISPSTTATASLTTALSGANNDLVFTAVTAGSTGNLLKVSYTNPGTASASESVSVSTVAGYQVIDFSLATDAGTSQVETAVVTGGGTGPTESGYLTCTITGASVTGSPLQVNVAVDHTVSTTFALLAADIRTALGIEAITGSYTVGGTGANVTLTKTVPAANDTTLNIAWEGSIAGITAVTSSTNTTPGVAPAITSTGDTIKATLLADATASALVTAADSGTDTGAGVVTAMSATALTGGGAGTERTYYVTLTNAAASTKTIRLGPPPLGGSRAGDYSTSLDVTHAAP